MIEQSYFSSEGGGLQTPNRIIVHSMGEYLDLGSEPVHATEFLDKVMKFSAHILVSPNGIIYRQRSDDQIAWHAKGHNMNTLGIEILVDGVWTYGPWKERIKEDWCSKFQFYVAAAVVRNWMLKWSITPQLVLRHSDVDPARKVDPGEGFDWLTFKELISLDLQ